MTQVTIIGGVLKREIIQQAYAECGQAGYEWELTPEEYDVALRRLDALLAEWRGAYGVELGYNFPALGGGSPEDESGLANTAVQVVVGMLALRIAPTIGKTISAETRAILASSFAAMRSAFNCPPRVRLDNRTPAGAGNRGYGYGRRNPFLLDVGCAEPVQYTDQGARVEIDY